MNDCFMSVDFKLSDMTEEQLTKLEKSIAEERDRRHDALKDTAREMFEKAFDFCAKNGFSVSVTIDVDESMLDYAWYEAPIDGVDIY